MASSSRMRQTVLRLIGLPNSSRARFARSVVDWRLSGLPVLATTSQAMEATTALSRGGKGGLAAASRVVLEGEPPSGPALPPEPEGVGVEIDPGGGSGIGKRGGRMEEQDQSGALAEVRRGGPGEYQASGLGQEILGEDGAMTRQRSRHQTTPKATGQLCFIADALTIAGGGGAATLQLIVKRTT
jgi:hypothetical protein